MYSGGRDIITALETYLLSFCSIIVQLHELVLHVNLYRFLRFCKIARLPSKEGKAVAPGEEEESGRLSTEIKKQIMSLVDISC